MSSISRPLADEALKFSLEKEASHLRESGLLERSGRSARTLVKDGPLRLTLIALGPGGSVAPHRAAGPVTLHVLAGAVRCAAAGREWDLGPDDVLSLGAGVEHDVSSATGGVFLLTVAHVEPDVSPAG